MDLKERMQYGRELREKAEAKGKAPYSVKWNDRRNRYGAYSDLRQKLLDAIEDSGVSKRSVAMYLGIGAQDLNSYFVGRHGLQYDLVEEILWLLGK